jgi:putative PIN family toxin of toxin-antitoxin system
VRVVLDPSVIAAAAISRGGPCTELLREFRAGAFELVASPRLLDETESLLRRPALQRHVSSGETAALLGLIRKESTLVDDPPPTDEPAVAEDPEDGYLVALARAGSARALVSADPHLTRLADRLPILTPTEFVLFLQ